MTHQQHVLLAVGTLTDRNRPMINALEFVRVTESCRDHHFQCQSFFQSIGSINAVTRDEMNFFAVLDETHSLEEEAGLSPQATSCFTAFSSNHRILSQHKSAFSSSQNPPKNLQTFTYDHLINHPGVTERNIAFL